MIWILQSKRHTQNEPKKILILVEPIYLEDHSDPSEDTYLWAYKVKIKNNSKESIKLLSRHWKIFDSNGNTEKSEEKVLLVNNQSFNQEMNLNILAEHHLKLAQFNARSYQMQDFKGRCLSSYNFSLDIQIMKKI